MWTNIRQDIEGKERKQVIYTLKRFFAGEKLLTYTNQDGFSIFIDSKKAILLDFSLKNIIGIVPISDYINKSIAMTITDVVFIRHLLRLRQEMLDKLKLKSLPWVLQPYYYIELSNGKKFSLPSLLTKFVSAAKRDSITLSSGLWKFMWYYNIEFNLPEGKLSILTDNTVKSMIQSNFIYNNKIVLKETVLSLK